MFGSRVSYSGSPLIVNGRTTSTPAPKEMQSKIPNIVEQNSSTQCLNLIAKWDLVHIAGDINHNLHHTLDNDDTHNKENEQILEYMQGKKKNSTPKLKSKQNVVKSSAGSNLATASKEIKKVKTQKRRPSLTVTPKLVAKSPRLKTKLRAEARESSRKKLPSTLSALSYRVSTIKSEGSSIKNTCQSLPVKPSTKAKITIPKPFKFMVEWEKNHPRQPKKYF